MSSEQLPFGLPIELTGSCARKTNESQRVVDPHALILRPVRHQGLLLPQTLDDLLGRGHPVRAIWEVVEGLELGELEGEVESNAVTGGRPAIAPQVLLTLWVYAISRGEGRASEIARLIGQHDVYRWIVGGLSVGERTLADFRMRNLKVFDELITQILTVLMNEELAEVSRVAQDGTRVRANAGTGSFRREGTLEALLLAAKEHYEAVMGQAQDPKRSKVEQKARERGARDRVERIGRAQALVKVLNAKASEEEKGDKKKAERASTTDPDARIMRMGDGGFRPAYNVQFATTTDGSGVVVGVSVSTRGSDQHEMGPMREQVEKRTGQTMVEQMVDGGYANREDIQAAESTGTMVLAPLPKKQADPNGRTAPESTDEIRQWQTRMQSEQGKERYKLRAEAAELTNARAKKEGILTSVPLRGVTGALVCATLTAFTINVGRLISLRASKVNSTPSANVSPSG